MKYSSWVVTALLATALALFAGPALAQSGSPSAKSESLEVQVLEVAADGSAAKLAIAGRPTASLPVESYPAQGLIRLAAKGDTASVRLDDNANPKAIRDVVAIKRQSGLLHPTWALAIALTAVLVFANLASSFQPQRFVIGADNRYSNSKLQMALWFGTLATVYIAALIMRLVTGGAGYTGGIGIPENLLMLSGFSALTYGAAKAITVQKIDSGLASKDLEKVAAAELKVPARAKTPPLPSLANLVQSDTGSLDLGDSQALFVTFLAVALYLLSAYHFLGSVTLGVNVELPNVDSTLLTGFGLGQGAYLVKKGVSDPGKG